MSDQFLAGIAEVQLIAGVELLGCEPGAREETRGARGEFPPELGQLADLGLGGGAQVGALFVDRRRGGQSAESREGRRGLRDEDPLDPQFLGLDRGEHGAVATVREHREVARVGAAFGRQPADGLRHVRVDDTPAIERGLFHVLAERPGDVLLERLVDALAGELDAAARELALLGQEPEHEVRISDARPRAAAAVADRAGVGAGAHRADFEASAADVTERAAAGPEGLHADHGKPHDVAVVPVPARARRVRRRRRTTDTS